MIQHLVDVQHAFVVLFLAQSKPLGLVRQTVGHRDEARARESEGGASDASQGDQAAAEHPPAS